MNEQRFDVIVIGGGHAGTEAAPDGAGSLSRAGDLFQLLRDGKARTRAELALTTGLAPANGIADQSGFIAAVGFETYLRLLEEQSTDSGGCQPGGGSGTYLSRARRLARCSCPTCSRERKS